MEDVQPSEHRRPRGLLAGALVVAVIGGVIGGVIADTISSPATPAPSSATSPARCPVAKVASADLPSVVTIHATNGSGGGTGSGEIIRSNGTILTNNHVVAPAVDGGALNVLLSNGRSLEAKLVGRDPQTDLAVIKVAGAGSLPSIPLGDSDTLAIGQPVIVLGAPLGLSSTVTSGIISALDRTIEVPGEGTGSALLIDAIQTDAAINPGNSGGALVGCDGHLVGIPSAGASLPSSSGEPSGSIGLGFAIPVNLAKRVSEEIIATGKVTHSYLGLQAEPLSTDPFTATGNRRGLLVDTVSSGGPAERAGLRVGDVIVTIGGKPAVSTDQLMALTLSKRPGDRVPIGLRRDGKEMSITVTLAART
ncbi:MAG: S1C family serine protease [Acidimicrobiales bacterium]